jgi:hypothetical protein
MGFNNMSQGMNVFRETAGGCGCQSGGACGAGGARKLTPYNKFVKKQFAVLKKQYPSKTAPEIMKLIGKKWRETKK